MSEYRYDYHYNDFDKITVTKEKIVSEAVELNINAKEFDDKYWPLSLKSDAQAILKSLFENPQLKQQED